MRMNRSILSNGLSGVLAALIYVVISLLTGAALNGSLLLESLALGAVVFLVSLVITRVISARKRRQAAGGR